MAELDNANMVAAAAAFTLLEERADGVARRLAMVANAKRLLILCYLAKAEGDASRAVPDVSVGELQQAVGLSQSALSQHLARLRAEDMVKTRRQAQTILYSLGDAETRTLMRALYDAFCGDM